MEDARLRRWLDLTDQAIGAPLDQLAAVLGELASERDELIRSLREDPPAESPDAELTWSLVETERALVTSTETLQTQLRKRVADLRRVRSAASGYRPTDEDIPTFVSKTI